MHLNRMRELSTLDTNIYSANYGIKMCNLLITS